MLMSRSTRGSTCLLLLLLSLSLTVTTGSNARRGPFQQEEAIDVDPAAMQGDPNDLTDEQLHLNHGSLTPTKLKAMKAEMQVLQQSLGNLMEKQTALQTKYEIESERAVEDKALKKKVKMEVARSLLKNLDQQSQSRTDMMESVVDKAINKVKEVYDIQIPHPDHPEEKEAMDAAAAEADAATGGSSSSTGGKGVDGAAATGGGGDNEPGDSEPGDGGSGDSEPGDEQETKLLEKESRRLRRKTRR